MLKSITTPFKITPIAKYRKLLHGSPEQTTLTQLNRHFVTRTEDFLKMSTTKKSKTLAPGKLTTVQIP